MATDKSEPKVGLIFQLGFFAVVALMALRFALGAYFDHATQSEELRKLGQSKPEALLNLRAKELERLGAGPMPIDKAMGQLAHDGRMAMIAELMPSASHDVAPLQGWLKMPKEVPSAMTAVAPSATVAVTITDGGAPDKGYASGDAGGGGNTPSDAGAKKKRP